MKMTCYFVIKPRQQLTQRIDHSDNAEWSAFLTEPELWTFEPGGRFSMDEQDRHVIVKSLYLANLKYLIQLDKIEVLFPSFQIAPSFFDVWWTAEEFTGIDEHCSSKMSALLSTERALEDLRAVDSPKLREFVDLALKNAKRA